MDWGTAAREGAELLSRYVRIDTSNPPGRELAAAQFLQEELARIGLEARLFEPGPGRANLWAVARGDGSAAPFILQHHLDVVPADPTAWHHHPFSGEITQGWVWGRGTIESKSLGVMHLLGLARLLESGLPLKRDIVYLAVCDGVSGAVNGSRWMWAEHSDLLRAEYLWQMGGFALIDVFCPQPVFSVAVTEKRVMWIRLIARGDVSHGSMPRGTNANDTLLAALGRASEMAMPLRVTPVAAQTFRQLSAHTAWPRSWFWRGLSNRLMLPLMARPLLEQPVLQAMLRDSSTITMLRSGLKANTVPASAEATLDVRLLPDEDPQAFIERLEKAIDDERVEINVLHYPEPVWTPPLPDPLYDAMADVARELVPDSLVAPIVAPGGTDARFYSAQGIKCFGLVPALLDAYEITLLHGVDERISVENLGMGAHYVYEVLKRLCT